MPAAGRSHMSVILAAACKPVCTPPALQKRQINAAQHQRQRWRKQQGHSRLQAARPMLAAAGDAGDDFEEMLGRREELLRIRDDMEEGLNTEDDEELSDLTERLLKYGYLEDTGSLNELASDGEEEGEEHSDDDGSEEEEEEEEEDEEEGLDAVAAGSGAQVDDDDVLPSSSSAAGGAGAEAAQRRKGGRGLKPVLDMTGIDAIVTEVQQGGIDDMRSQMQAGGGAAQTEEAEDPGAKFPEPPQRSYSLAELLRLAGYEDQAASAPDIEISNLLTCNSISGGEGSLYVCVPSSDGLSDGHDWADEASEMGAVAVLAGRPLPDALLPVVVVEDVQEALTCLADAFYQQPSRRMRTIGFVGSYGKTTSAWLARGMFEETGERCGMIGSIEYALEEVRLSEEGDVWVPEEEDITLQRDCSSPFHITPYAGKYPEMPATPDVLHVQKVLAGCADRGGSTTLLECEPASLGDGRLDRVDFDVMVFTNSYAEKEEAAEGGSKQYRTAVSRLFQGLQHDIERQRAVVNVDDQLGAQLAQQAAAAGVTVLTYSLDSRDADIFAEKVKSTIWESEVLVNTPLGRLQIITPLLGRTNVYNVLAAVSAGIACGVPLKSIVAGIEAVDIIPGRSEIVDEGQPFSVVVDSASNPQQLSRLLDDVKEAGAKRVLLVFGCPGTTTRDQRQEMANMAHYKADAIYLTNDSPGTSWPSDIIADMVSGLPTEVLNKYAGTSYPYLQDPHRVPHWFQKYMLQYQSVVGVYVIEDRFQAIRVAIGMARAREVVIVVGKGHIDYQEYWDGAEWEPEERETLKSWFDDRVECRNALSKLSYLNGIKDLNTDVLPWTRFPEERDILVMEGIVDAPVGDYR